jgi:hypothetical protein
VVLLPCLDLGDGSDAAANFRRLAGIGPAVEVFSASAKPDTVREIVRAGACGYMSRFDDLDCLAWRPAICPKCALGAQPPRLPAERGITRLDKSSFGDVPSPTGTCRVSTDPAGARPGSHASGLRDLRRIRRRSDQVSSPEVAAELERGIGSL